MGKVKLLTSAMAAKILGLSQEYVRRLCRTNKIQSQKIGHDWLFPESAIKDIKRQRSLKEKTEEV